MKKINTLLMFLMAGYFLSSCMVANDVLDSKHVYFKTKDIKPVEQSKLTRVESDDQETFSLQMEPGKIVPFEKSPTTLAVNEPMEKNPVKEAKSAPSVKKNRITSFLANGIRLPSFSNTATFTREAPRSEPADDDVDILILVLLAILLPPVAVFLVDGLGTSFWINVILTILGWLPGVIHALIVIFSREDS